MSKDPKHIAELSLEEKRAILAQLLQKKMNNAENRQFNLQLAAISRPKDVPSSFAQERIWLLDQLSPGNHFYNISLTLRLDGPLYIAALEKSLNALVHRHEALRTTFTMAEGQLIQVIAQDFILLLPVIDFQMLIETKRKELLQQLLTEEAQLPFDLHRGPLMRATLLRLGTENHVLLLTMHHIVFDDWSTSILWHELRIFYDAYCAGHSPILPELPIQYADYAVWQRQWLQGDVLSEQIAYWKQQLRGTPIILELPTDYPRPAVQTYQGATQYFKLSELLTKKIKALSQQENVTLFMILLAAFQILLYRYSGQEHIVVGSPIANRNRVEIEGLIGFFVNTLVLHTDLSDDPSFQELLRRVREVTLEAYDHQDLPFEKLVEIMQPERDMSYNPLFQVMFMLQNTPEADTKLINLTSSPAGSNIEAAVFDITMIMVETECYLEGKLEYKTSLFEPATIKRMAGHFQTLLEGIAIHPEQRISNLPLLSEKERYQLLTAWNATHTSYPQTQCIHQLFEAQAESTPDALAAIFEQEHLTYYALNQRAQKLAHYLQKNGLMPEMIVGIFVERSLEMIIGLLGILKAGGAYVPLDPSYPKERLTYILEDSQVRMILTQQRFATKLPTDQVRGIFLDSDWNDTITHESPMNLPCKASADNLAYVIYTSGSTGKPKGVAMPHKPLLNLIQWQHCHLGESKQVRTLQLSSLCFDASFNEAFSTWHAGGTLLLISEGLQRDALGLLYLLKREAIERMFPPVASLQFLTEVFVSPGPIPDKLCEILCTAEQLRMSQSIENLFDSLHGCTLYNEYGPSETHVVTSFMLTNSPQSWPAFPPIGRPIANTQIYLLDRNLYPVPIGVPGELYIGGMGLARGYLNHPELTAERFIPNVFSDEPGARLYKTGDLAYYQPDGNIKFLRRIDQQVKVRGYRIELGEIEVVLSQHPAVREAVVVVREDTPGDKRLVAYIISNQEQASISNELHTYLSGRLPTYMIPSFFIILEKFPLNPSGKIDRRAMPIPSMSRAGEDEEFVAPCTSTEEALTKIWLDVLGLEQISMHDNFFGLGGHSLSAARVVSRLRITFQVDLSLRCFFETPTVAELSKTIDKLRFMSTKIREHTIVPLSREKYRMKPSSLMGESRISQSEQERKV